MGYDGHVGGRPSLTVLNLRDHSFYISVRANFKTSIMSTSAPTPTSPPPAPAPTTTSNTVPVAAPAAPVTIVPSVPVTVPVVTPAPTTPTAYNPVASFQGMLNTVKTGAASQLAYVAGGAVPMSPDLDGDGIITPQERMMYDLAVQFATMTQQQSLAIQTNAEKQTTQAATSAKQSRLIEAITVICGLLVIMVPVLVKVL